MQVPPEVERLMTAQVAAEMAEGDFGVSVVYPEQVVVDTPESNRYGSGRRFPGWPGDVLVLADECQGVCSWGVPLGGAPAEVLVGGSILNPGDATVRYAASVADFIVAQRWDQLCLSRSPVLQAQAPELDQASLARLAGLLRRAVPTAGWPGSRQYRFGDDSVRVLLWAGDGRCDWWISAANATRLRAFTAGLMDLPGLGGYLWSADEAGERLLAELTG